METVKEFTNSQPPVDDNQGNEGHLKSGNLLNAALRYLKMGFSVIPAKPRTKLALVPWKEFSSRSPTEEEIRAWWESNPDANIAIVLGEVSGVICLEVDDLESIKGRHIPVTPQAISGGKILPHYYFRYKPGIEYYKSQENGRELFSIRTNGQYVVVPPSVHPSGRPYEWAPGFGIHEVELADPPEWVLDLASKVRNNKPPRQPVPLDIIPEGGRNDFLFKYGCSLLSRGIAIEEVGSILGSLNKTKCDPPLEEGELALIIESVAKYKDADLEPIPLPKKEVTPFPLEVFPATLQKVLTEYANSIGCPIDYLALPLIVAAGVAIGNSRIIEIKKGWVEGARVFAAVVGKPGSRKSPASRAILMTIYKIQEEMADEYEQRRDEYKKDLNTYEGELRVWRGSKDGEPKPAPPEEPFMRQIFTSDSTLEALATVMKRNPRGVLYNSDELTGWVRSFNQYKAAKGADRQAWLSLWSGTTMVINRKNNPSPVVIDNPFVGVTGSLPPEVLTDLIDESGREDGFIHRILFAFPDTFNLDWTEQEISSGSFEELERAVRGLNALEGGLNTPKTIRFGLEARRIWVEFIEEHYKDQEDPIFPDSLRGPWAKMEGYAARLALIIHMLRYICDETADEDIDEQSMSAAADLIDYFKSQTQRVYAELRTTPEDRKAEKVWAWIQKQGGTVTAREVLRSHVGGIKKSDEAKKTLRDLAERGYGSVTEGKNGNVLFFANTKATGDNKVKTEEKEYDDKKLQQK